MLIHEPCTITSRLCAGVRVGGAEISIEYHGTSGDGRTVYHYYIDIGEYSYDSTDLKSGCGGGSLQDGLESLLSFLGACGAAVSYQDRTGRVSENSDLFPKIVGEWADQHSDELAMLQCELEELGVAIDG